METDCHKITNIIIEVLNDKYTFINFKVLKEDPITITMSCIDEIELMKGYGDQEIDKTNYELLENIIIAVVEDIRALFDLDCDYSIGTENIVEITLF